MKHHELIIIGGGPSGLCAAKMAAEAGIDVLIIDRSPELGGQLIKQTHKFFGSKAQYAKTRGFDIAKILIDQVIHHPHITILKEATVVGLYPDRVVTVYQHETYTRYQADRIIVATGASEKFLAFENNDLPGIYGAGAVQTLMNLYGVLPGQEIIMVGSGNIGLIVSYQLLQAGVHVKGIVEAAPTIGGYKVHASKIRRLGVPIWTSTTVQRAMGKDHLEAVELIDLDAKWQPLLGTERIMSLDALCISVGLSPMHQLLSMVNAKTKYINELGGFVPIIDDHHQTTVKGIYACGDAVGIEEASSAMMEGYLTGLYVATDMQRPHPDSDALKEKYEYELDMLRNGPFGIKTKIGLEKLRKDDIHAQ
jgi:sarcosine oxidase subunit alpha